MEKKSGNCGLLTRKSVVLALCARDPLAPFFPQVDDVSAKNSEARSDGGSDKRSSNLSFQRGLLVRKTPM